MISGCRQDRTVLAVFFIPGKVHKMYDELEEKYVKNIHNYTKRNNIYWQILTKKMPGFTIKLSVGS